MNVFVSITQDSSLALTRVEQALRTHAKNVTIVESEHDADLIVLHVVGRRDATLKKASEILARGQSYAVIQYCIRSTKTPHTAGWLPLWQQAKVVWSYYNLPVLCREDGVGGSNTFLFYYSPLGANSTIFKPYRSKKHHLILTSGRSYLTESVKECVLAARRFGQTAIHLGHELNVPDLKCFSGLDDKTLTKLYQSCYYVSGLRRTEGFELPAVEGLLCRVRPILFDRPHYREWYGNWAEYIPEEPREKVIESLVKLFQKPYRPVTARERDGAKNRFDWKMIAGGFWERVINP